MASIKKPSRIKAIEKRKLLGSFLILSFVAFGATIVTFYLVIAKVDVFKTALASLFVGGLLAVFIEMRGKMGEKIYRIRARTRPKTKLKKEK